MALIVETGTGAADAQSYASAADSNAYMAVLGVLSWDARDDELKEADLARATAYMQQMYGGRWLGLRVTATQALDWPRADVQIADVKAAAGTALYYETTVVPAAVKRACIELAYRASTGELLADQQRAVSMEQIGPLVTKYEKGSSAAVKFPAVDLILKPLLKPSGLSVTTGRA